MDSRHEIELGRGEASMSRLSGAERNRRPSGQKATCVGTVHGATGHQEVKRAGISVDCAPERRK